MKTANETGDSQFKIRKRNIATKEYTRDSKG